jgi:hypothetical protein
MSCSVLVYRHGNLRLLPHLEMSQSPWAQRLDSAPTMKMHREANTSMTTLLLRNRSCGGPYGLAPSLLFRLPAT